MHRVSCVCVSALKERSNSNFLRVLKDTFYFNVFGFNSLYEMVVKNFKKGQKNDKKNSIQLVLATQFTCAQLNKAKRFQLLQNTEEATLWIGKRGCSLLVLNH